MVKKWFDVRTILIIFFLHPFLGHASTIGSDTAVSRLAVQQLVHNGDRIAGFVALDGGFVFANNISIATFDSFFPVQGAVDLNGSTLILTADLILKNLTNVSLAGLLLGNNHNLEFHGISTLNSSSCVQLSDVHLVIDQNLTVNGCLKLSGESSINGNGHIISIGSSGSIIIDTGATVLFDNVIVHNVHSGQLICLDDTALLSLQQTQLILDNDFTFSHGQLNIIDEVVIAGNGFSFLYAAAVPISIGTDASFILDEGVTFTYQPPNNSRTNLQFVDNTAEIKLNNATFLAGGLGITFTKGNMIVQGESWLNNVHNLLSNSFAFGDGIAVENNFSIVIKAAATLIMNTGQFSFNNVT